MRMKRWLSLLMALMIVMTLPTGAMAAKKTKASIKLPAKVALVFVDEELQVKPKLKGVTSDSLTYATSADGVVTVSDTGLMKGVAVGKVSLGVASGSLKAKCTVLVLPKSITVKKGEKLKLPAASKVKFKMKSKKIATVSSKGVVKGVKGGATKLAVKYGKQTRTIDVTVDPGESKAAKLDAASETDQIVLVEYKSGSKATLSVHEKTDGKWKQLFSTPAYVGKKGIGKTKEGDKKTPTGTFNLTTPFGIKADPGAQMDYLKVTDDHYWCGTSGSEYYNQLVTVSGTGRKWTKDDEHLIDYKGNYNYCMFIDYNASGVSGKGSCIFLHCKGKSSSTAGCVAVSEASMKKIIQWAKKGAKIVIKKA